MADHLWLALTLKEQAVLHEALLAYAGAKHPDNAHITALVQKVRRAEPHPDITVGVYGGQVQWTLGNPFPIRICDYDGDSDEDLPNVDARGQRCRMWLEVPDTTIDVR